MKNSEINIKDIRFKPLSVERLTISFDRLTRFKDYEQKYTRVFSDILTESLIYPKYKKTDLENMDYEDLKELAVFIINSSFDNGIEPDFTINNKIKEYELRIFDCGKNAVELLNNDINYKALISLLPDNDIPNNLKWLKLIANKEYSPSKSHSMGLKYPIEKLIICEGITEEILLPEFAKLLDYDFDKNGIKMISAGGKNQVVKLFYKISDIIKIPVFILLDSDAGKNRDEILPKLKKKDKIYILNNGEFEDILPVSLIEKSLKYSIENISESPVEHFDKTEGAVHYLEEFYKTRGAHEFKKAEFAHIVKENISGIKDVSEEFKEIIDKIKNL